MVRAISLAYTFLVHLFLSAVASATSFDGGLGLARPDFQSIHAERLIHALNLFHDHDVNLVSPSADGNGSSLDSSGKKLVEKRFTMPNIADGSDSGVTVEDLGHHAGYYKIEHSYDARSVFLFFFSFSWFSSLARVL